MSTTLDTTAATSSSPSVLAKVLEPGCNLAIWERETLPGVELLVEGSPKGVRFTAPISALATQLPEELAKSGFVEGETVDAFAADVLELAQHFTQVLDLDQLTVRVEVVTTNSCRKWHGDYVTARLITTYVGSGTDWIDHHDAARVRNGLGPKQIHSLGAGDVGMFQGKLGNDDPAIHRSPPIAGTGEKRLLVVLNPPEDT